MTNSASISVARVQRQTTSTRRPTSTMPAACSAAVPILKQTTMMPRPTWIPTVFTSVVSTRQQTTTMLGPTPTMGPASLPGVQTQRRTTMTRRPIQIPIVFTWVAWMLLLPISMLGPIPTTEVVSTSVVPMRGPATLMQAPIPTTEPALIRRLPVSTAMATVCSILTVTRCVTPMKLRAAWCQVPATTTQRQQTVVWCAITPLVRVVRTPPRITTMPWRRCQVAIANTSVAQTLQQTTSLQEPTSMTGAALMADAPTPKPTTLMATLLWMMAAACMQVA